MRFRDEQYDRRFDHLKLSVKGASSRLCRVRFRSGSGRFLGTGSDAEAQGGEAKLGAKSLSRCPHPILSSFIFSLPGRARGRCRRDAENPDHCTNASSGSVVYVLLVNTSQTLTNLSKHINPSTCSTPILAYRWLSIHSKDHFGTHFPRSQNGSPSRPQTNPQQSPQRRRYPVLPPHTCDSSCKRRLQRRLRP